MSDFDTKVWEFIWRFAYCIYRAKEKRSSYSDLSIRSVRVKSYKHQPYAPNSGLPHTHQCPIPFLVPSINDILYVKHPCLKIHCSANTNKGYVNTDHHI
jgi:hypothetical protein